MIRATITLPDDLARLAKREAERRRTSVSEVVRSALTNELRPSGRRDIPWGGAIDDASLTPAREVDALLFDSWADGIAGDR